MSSCVAMSKSSAIVFGTVLVFSSAHTVLAAGYQIPNQSLRAVGIAGATIAYTPGAEASYYNPANMSLLADGYLLETSVTMLNLPAIDYRDNRSPALDGRSDSEMFYLPQLHFVGETYGALRFGFSLTFPYGLAKSWDQPYPAATAGTFSLDVIEASPTLSWALTDTFSLGGGLRFVYSEGEVQNGAVNPPFSQLSPLTSLSRELEGDDTALGYTLAATLTPVPALRLAATYKSEVELDLEGDATLLAAAGSTPVAGYSGNASLEVPLPAVLSLAGAYTLGALTFEIAWSRTFWSAVESFDFEYDVSFLGTAFDGFDRPLAKNWDDSDALRFGLTWEVNDRWQATCGFAIDETPVPDETLGFELPDSDAFMYGIGLKYQISEKLNLGASYMYYHTTSRAVAGSDVAGLPGINGTFDDGGAHAVNLAAVFMF